MAVSLKMPHVAVVEAGQDSDEDDFSVSGESEEEGSDDEGVEGMQEASGQSDGDEAEDEEEDEEQNEDEAANPNAGWAEAMAKILRKKTQENKPSILLKNKQRDKQKESMTKGQQEKKKQADKRKAWEMMCRVKPDVVQDKEKERNLQRTATRGVVQLFNAVRNHQKKVGEKIKEVGDSERKKAKVMSAVTKKDFIDILRGAAGMNTSTIKTEQPEVKEEKPAWSVLRDDFMMGAAMKDWDKESDGDERNKEARPADGDGDTD